MELIPIRAIVEEMEQECNGRSKGVHAAAKRLNITVPTLYRWLKDDDHFLVDEGEVESVFKLVKCNYKDGEE